LLSEEGREELSGGYSNTTNNRMELTAAIKGLEALSGPSDVTLLSDSQYLVNSINKGWVLRWQSNGWKRNKKEYALNIDLWKKLLKQLAIHSVQFKWTRGHAGDPENERCDLLATRAAAQPDLPEEENTSTPGQGNLF
jgi:ribonuclease HI